MRVSSSRQSSSVLAFPRVLNRSTRPPVDEPPMILLSLSLPTGVIESGSVSINTGSLPLVSGRDVEVPGLVPHHREDVRLPRVVDQVVGGREEELPIGAQRNARQRPPEQLLGSEVLPELRRDGAGREGKGKQGCRKGG